MNVSAEPTISIICVFNDPQVRSECLDASVARLGTSVQYVPVDNVDHQFASAGAALNHGASMATGEVLVFVHQDVYLHAMGPLLAQARRLGPGGWGMIGAAGITSGGVLVGSMRDRMVLTGVDADEPVEVDSVDEVLFMVRRDLVAEQPLVEVPALAWHGYAVEYGLRLRALGLRTGAANCAVTHNSLTINLDRLDVAHLHLAEVYPTHTPVRTTCGIVGAQPSRLRTLPVIRDHVWRRRWLRESLLARRASRRFSATRTVLADIRLDLDVLAWDEAAPLVVANLDHDGGFVRHAAEPLELHRRDRLVSYHCYPGLAEALARHDVASPESSWLFTNVTLDDLTNLRRREPSPPSSVVLGVHEHQVWLLMGPMARQEPEEWASSRAVPWRVAT